MPNNTFDQGVDYGGLRSFSDIRLLICYLLNSIGLPVSKIIINNAIAELALANYFEVNQAFSDLEENGQLERSVIEDEELFTVTESGKDIAKTLETNLSWTVRTKTVKAAINLMTTHKRTKENNIEILKTESGYKVNMDIFGSNNSKEESNKILSLSVYAGDALQAEQIKKGMISNPTNLCHLIISTLLEDDIDINSH